MKGREHFLDIPNELTKNWYKAFKFHLLTIILHFDYYERGTTKLFKLLILEGQI